MRTLLLVIVAVSVAVIPVAASAQFGVIGLYTDAAGSNCEVTAVQGGVLFVNSDGSCPCFTPVQVCESTWGQIKSLYGE